MNKSHRLMVQTAISTDMNSETAVAYATKWLLDELGDIEVFNQVSARTWKGDYHVQFLVQLDEEQVETVHGSDHIEHLEVVK